MTPKMSNPTLALPSEVVHVIVEKIPHPILDCSNPFSILGNCTFVDLTSSTSKSTNLIETQRISEASILGLQAFTIAALSYTISPEISNHSSSVTTPQIFPWLISQHMLQLRQVR